MKPINLIVIVANALAFVAGAAIPAGSVPTAPAKLFPTSRTLTPTTEAAGLVPIALPATPQPAVDFPARQRSIDKKLFYQVGLDGSGAVPAGCLPYIVDGGLRFDSDPKTPGFQEDSAWVYGYYGQGATAANGWKATGEFHQRVVPSKMRQLAEQLPPDVLYVVNVENLPTDINSATDATVEDSIRRLRSIFGPLAAGHLGDVGIWGIAPAANYYASSNYGGAMRALAKLQRGEPMTELEYWYVGQVATYDRWGSGSLAMNPAAPAAAAWSALQATDDRLTYGRTAQGQKNNAGGLTAATTVSLPACYDHEPGDDSADYIERSVSEARRINPGKPVYVFMWATYHPGGGSPRGGQAIDLPEWTTELDQAFAVADGVVLWSTDTASRPEHVAAAQAALARARRKGLN